MPGEGVESSYVGVLANQKALETYFRGSYGGFLAWIWLIRSLVTGSSPSPLPSWKSGCGTDSPPSPGLSDHQPHPEAPGPPAPCPPISTQKTSLLLQRCEGLYLQLARNKGRRPDGDVLRGHRT